MSAAAVLALRLRGTAHGAGILSRGRSVAAAARGTAAAAVRGARGSTR
eukprot:CAMPEP_0184386766 /NCGR_PEP_ID=MMETSP0007-20130409/10093_1 /TAXON_ID=97485 /ORGANISM="Prymnesium parvum, Strain Texoma1" /LENGTH=47 /DNA_ID= /DNA_START= /DNA_END= /DNA_ORIENTATION=